MNVQHDLERRIADFYAREAPPRAPDWVLESALSTIQSTPQRRVLLALPWRLNQMNGFAKLAVAAVIVMAAGIVGMSVLQPRGAPGPGGSFSPAPSPSSSPSAAPTATRTPRPSPSPYVPSPLTETFTSDLHGLSLSYPTGWATQQATQPWQTATPITWGEPFGDFVFDPRLRDHLFVAAGSQPLGEMSLEEVTTALVSDDGCPTEAVVIDGADGLLADNCRVATVASGGRWYAIWMYVSGDDAELRTFEYRPFFEEILATVQLVPEAASDTAPSASP